MNGEPIYTGSVITISNLPPSCPYCNAWHRGTCPRIKALAYYPNGTLKSIELHPIGGSS